jgi:hypothetical protein
MMLKRSVFAALWAIGALVAATGHAQVVIGNFEGGSLDGWDPAFDVEAGPDPMLFSDNFYGATTATNGTYALNVANFVRGPGKFRWNIVLEGGDFPNLAALLVANPILKMDVSWVTDEWLPDSTPADPNDDWAKWEKLSINDNTGWQEVNVTTDPVNPGFPGSWDANNFGASHTRTLTYDTRTDVNGMPMNIDTGGFVQIYLATNYSGKYLTNQPGGSFWIDNIRLEPIPEPTSLAMAAMIGVLPVVRRRFGRG